MDCWTPRHPFSRTLSKPIMNIISLMDQSKCPFLFKNAYKIQEICSITVLDLRDFLDQFYNLRELAHVGLL